MIAGSSTSKSLINSSRERSLYAVCGGDNKQSVFFLFSFFPVRNNQPARCCLIGWSPSAAHRASLPARLSYTSPPCSKQSTPYPPKRGDPRVHCAEHPALSLEPTAKNCRPISSPRATLATCINSSISIGRTSSPIHTGDIRTVKRHQYGVARLSTSAPTQQCDMRSTTVTLSFQGRFQEKDGIQPHPKVSSFSTRTVPSSPFQPFAVFLAPPFNPSGCA